MIQTVKVLMEKKSNQVSFFCIQSANVVCPVENVRFSQPLVSSWRAAFSSFCSYGRKYQSHFASPQCPSRFVRHIKFQTRYWIFFFFSTIVIFLRVFRSQLNEAASHSLPLPTLSSSLFTKCISTGQSHFLGLHCYLNDCLCLKAILSRVAAEAK